jgi:hypothetical protein
VKGAKSAYLSTPHRHHDAEQLLGARAAAGAGLRRYSLSQEKS